MKNIQSDKARLGAIGENMVVVKLMEEGWDAFNANCTIKNFKSIDIICLRADFKESNELWWKPKTALIQVKTSVQNTIPVGFSIKDCLDKEYLETMVKGPYVFLSIKKEEDNKNNYRFYIISRKQFIELLYQSNIFYVNGYFRKAELNKEAPACMKVSWLEGKSEKANSKHTSFVNPLHDISTENCWENIWED